MDSANIPPMDAPVQEAPALKFPQRLGGIFFEPRTVFRDLDRKTSWLGMYILVSVLAIASSFALYSRMPPDLIVRKGMEMNPMTKSMSEEQKEQIIAQQSARSGSWQNYVQIAFAPLGVLVVYLICAGALLLVFVLMGASLSFKKSLAVTVWGLAPPGIVLVTLGTILLYVKDPEALDIVVQNNVISNLGLLVSDKEHPVLNTFLTSMDAFSFWSIYLLGVGFSTVSERKLTMGQAVTGVLMCWALWVLLKMGFFAIFG